MGWGVGGQVKYRTEEFMAKNVDAVVLEHQALLAASQRKVVREMMEGGEAETQTKFTSLGLTFRVRERDEEGRVEERGG